MRTVIDGCTTTKFQGCLTLDCKGWNERQFISAVILILGLTFQIENKIVSFNKERKLPSVCFTALIYGTPKLVLVTFRKSSDQPSTKRSTVRSSTFCCSIVFSIPFKSSIFFRSFCWLLNIFLTGMRFCSSLLEASPSLSPLSEETEFVLSAIIEMLSVTWSKHLIEHFMKVSCNYSCSKRSQLKPVFSSRLGYQRRCRTLPLVTTDSVIVVD